MAITRRQHPPTIVDILGQHTVDVMLSGWGGAWTGDDPDPFRTFHADLPALWREHRADLLAEAQRRGIAAWGLRFDGETK